LASYNNRSLFSDYYLEELVGEDPHWRALKNKVWEYRQRISNILEKALPGINGDTPEAEVERRLIRPILDVLGHIYFVQPAVHSPEGVRRPDYAFFPSPEIRQEAESHKGQPEFFKNALAVGDAKAWERSLDKRVKGAGDPFTNHNPSYQIDFYLRATDKRWGLLTNGRHWRLYHRDLSYRLDVYYEVDLPQIITLDEDAFLYFLAFFHKEAFQPDGTSECFLDRAYRASTEYAAKVSEELKDNVYEALRLLVEGFLSFSANNLEPENLDLVRENAFIVIYRLLFTLYAEAREFLPVTNPTYWGTYSLRALTHEIATKEPFESQLSPTTTIYWSRLRELFNLINSGDRFLYIPPYNGRLFDDQKEHQRLAAWKIGDSYLAGAIDQLARARAAGRTGRGFVSYRDLSIRELGSIYEGLLEHRPRYATQDVAVVKEEKRERFVPVVELGNRKALKTYRAGSVYLETDKGERKATGSYYTPDYIVKYIVSNTVRPLIEEAKKSSGNMIEAILSLKVLDPAMGSGHFLVEATDYLARALVEALGGDPREMEEDEVRWARREVVERCIYGVDLNPLAVDLAKLSLWLSTVSLDKPLNFLDHHLRCGNSLIGARLEDIGLLPEIGKKSKPTAVTTLAGHQFKSAIASAVSTFHKIAEEPSDSVEDIHRKEGAYETARYALSRIKSIADVWASVYFENEVKDKDAYERLLYLAEKDDAGWPGSGELPWLDRAKATAEGHRFFHWELEFPEVFFDRDGQRLANPGFDSVVGNPPYVSYGLGRTGKLPTNLEGYFRQLYPDSAEYKISTYAMFMERAHQLTHLKGYSSLIVPDSFLTGSYFSKIRRLLLTGSYLKYIVLFVRDFWESGEVGFPTIYVSQKMKADVEQSAAWKIHHSQLTEPEELVETLTYATTYQTSMLANPSLRIHLIGELAEDHIVEKMKKSGDTLVRLLHLHHGIRSKIGRANIIAETKLDSRWKEALISSGEITRFSIEPQEHYILVDPQILFSGGWDATLIEQKKLLLRRTGDSLISAVDKRGFYHTNALIYGCIFAESKSWSIQCIASILNSRLLNWAYRILSMKAGRTLPQVEIDFVHTLPIRRINFTTQKAERDQMVQQSKSLYEEYLQTKNWDKVLTFVDERLPQKIDGSPDTEHEQSDVVHDLLAFLAEEMTRLHKEKQVEIKGFLTWLEGYLGVGVEELKNKTKVKEYWKAEVCWDGFLGALEQNRRAIELAKGVNVTHRGPQEIIKAEFDKSVAKLRPLLESIELTDKLIDQIVYKLYGLTKAEIAVVEGRG
jgi:hypothetical protein